MEKIKVASTKMGKRNWLIIIVLGLIGQIAWGIENSWFNTFIFDEITPDPQAIAIMVGVSAVVATVGTLIMGTLSDRIGKRKIFMIGGYVLWGISTIAFPLSAMAKTVSVAILLVITLDAIMTFFGSTAYDAAYNAWVTDNTDDTNRGFVTSIVLIMPVFSGILLAASGAIIDNFGYNTFFYGIGSVVTIGGLLVGLLIKESPTLLPNKTSKGKNFFKYMISVFSAKSIKENTLLYQIFVVMCIGNIAFQVIMAYDMIYLNNYLDISKTLASLLSLFAMPAILLASIFVGKLNDKGYGYTLLSWAPAIITVGLVSFSFSVEFWQLIITKSIFFVGFFALMVSAQAQIKNLMPEDQRGQFQGANMVFMVLLPMVIGPSIGSFLIRSFGIPTVLNGSSGFIPTPIIYQVAGGISLLSYIGIYFINKTSKDKIK